MKEMEMALRLFNKTRASLTEGRDIPTISFDELKVEFQNATVMHLRNWKICVLSSNRQGKPGVMLRHEYARMSFKDFQYVIKTNIWARTGKGQEQ